MSDPCECLFNHEAMIRRLLSLLRDALTDCTDSECLPTESGVNTVSVTSGSGNMVLIAILWGLFAMLMFFFRPNSMRNSLRRNPQTEEKPDFVSSSNNNNNEPPEPDVF